MSDYGHVGIHLMREAESLFQRLFRSQTAGLIEGGKLQAGGIAGQLPASTLPAHHQTHEAGGSDSLDGLIDGNARLAVSQAGSLIGTRRRIDLIAGAGISLAVLDDGAGERVRVTISAPGTGAGSPETLVIPGDPPDPVVADGDFIYVAYS